jgi:hypothetical protein
MLSKRTYVKIVLNCVSFCKILILPALGEQKLLIELCGLTREIMQWRYLDITENVLSLNSRVEQVLVRQVEDESRGTRL